MSMWAVAPLILTAIGVGVAVGLPAGSSPRVTTLVLSGASVFAVVGFLAWLVVVVVGGFAQVHSVSDFLGWCRDPGVAGGSGWSALVAMIMLVVSASRGAAVALRTRRDQRLLTPHLRSHVTVIPGPVAFAVPGRAGGVVLGTEVLEVLDPSEVMAVVAHEEAHLRHGHARYLMVTTVCAAVLPLLRPVDARARFATERWADECAVTEVGSRSTVARAIARVALLGVVPSVAGSLAFGSRANLARIKALTHPPGQSLVRAVGVAMGFALVTTLVGATVQAHHLAEFIAAMCRL